MVTRRKTKTRRRFIAYARVSKVGDRGDDLLSPELQQRSMDAYAASHDIDVVDRVVDLDESGRRFEKRAVKNMIARVEAGEADGVLLWKWSRWGRNLLQSKIYLEQVEKAGGEVRAATEDFDTRTAVGNFMQGQIMLVDELLSNQISEGWKATQARRVELRLMPGGPAPFGYARPEYAEGASRHDRPLVPHPVNGPLLVECYERYLRGQGPQKLVDWLNNDVGVKTPARRSKQRGDTEPVGQLFTVVTLQRMLDSGFAAGYVNLDVRHDRHQVRGAHEPLIDERTWDDYQRERERRRRVHPRVRHPRWHLGGGLAICGLCGANLVINTYTGAKSQALCSAYRRSQTCTGVWINRRTVEDAVDEWLENHLTQWADRQDELHDVDSERTRLARELDAARDEERGFDEGRRDALRLVGRGLATRGEVAVMLAEVEVERRVVTDRIAELTARREDLSPDGDVLDRLEAGLVTEPDERNVLLRRLLQRVVVAPESITVRPWHGEAWIFDRA